MLKELLIRKINSWRFLIGHALFKSGSFTFVIFQAVSNIVYLI